MERREFLTSTAAAIGSTAMLLQAAEKLPASERIRVGCIGAAGRGGSLVRTFSKSPQADVVAIADLDPGRLASGVAASEKIQGFKPKGVKDFRELIDDNSLDAIVVGTPDHWHAIPTIMACQAGKDVYVEKPDSHNIVEGRTMVAAMQRHKRIIQMGSQHRTTQRLITALEYIATGALGKCLVAKAWESARQGSIGHPPDSDPPKGIDYDFWLGSAPKRPFNIKRFHGNWRWFHDYGTGDLGNDGVHRLDMAIAGLNVALKANGDPEVAMPHKISATGGKWYFDDMQEFPDTLQVNYEFAGTPPRLLTYEMRLWAPYQEYGHTEGSAIFGDKGYIILGNSTWQAYGPKNQLVAQGEGDSYEGPHVEDFLNCIKTRNKPACDLETIGHPASVLCHAGNIAARVGRTLTLNAETETFENDDAANVLRTREEYRKPWELPEV